MKDNTTLLMEEEKKSLIKRYKAGRKSRFKKWSVQERIILITTTVLFSLYALTLIYPFVFAFINSIKPYSEFLDDMLALPKQAQWQNFAQVFKRIKFKNVDFWGMVINSVWQTLLATSCGLVASTLMAYVTAKYDFKFLKILYAVGIFSMVIPIIGSTPAMYKLLDDLNIVNQPAKIWVIWFNGFGFAYLVLYSYFKTVSWTYAEAAFIDGAGHFRVFIEIMVPQALPAISSILIVNAIGYWNDYMTAYLFLDKYPNLALGLYELKESVNLADGGKPVYYAFMLMSLIPVAAAFIIFQKAIMKNITTGGLKG